MTITNEQAKILAAAIRPQVKAYIEANRERYEAFLQAEREKEGGGNN